MINAYLLEAFDCVGDDVSDTHNVFKGAWNTTKTGDEEI